MAERPAIDPRYDPAFQRGYAGPTAHRADAEVRDGAPRVTSALQRDVGPPPGPARADTPAHPAAAASATPPADAAPELGADAAAPAVVHVAAPAPRPPWTNPFVVLIAVIGVAVSAMGAWLLQTALQLTQSARGPTTETDYWLLQWAMIASPVILSLGVCVLVTVLVFCAVYWARRPGSE